MSLCSEDTIEYRRQTLHLSVSRLASLREWATERSGVAAGVCVTDPDNRIVLIQNSWSDGWFFPGGAVEQNERPAEAAQREVLEETGLDATIEEPLAVIEQDFVSEADDGAQFSGYFVLYAAQAEGAIPRSNRLGISNDEIADARWFETPPENIHERNLVLKFWNRCTTSAPS